MKKHKTQCECCGSSGPLYFNYSTKSALCDTCNKSPRDSFLHRRLVEVAMVRKLVMVQRVTA